MPWSRVLLRLLAVPLLAFGLARPGQAQAPDLTGLWQDENGATYRLRQVGDRLFWMADGRPAWLNVFVGQVAGGTITGDWADLPDGNLRQAGRLVLRIESADRLRRLEASPFPYGSATLSRIGATPPPGGSATAASGQGAPPTPGAAGTAPGTAPPPAGGTATATPGAPPPPGADEAWSTGANSRVVANGVPMAFACPGGVGPHVFTRRGLWGTDIYTHDSVPCLAGVHAGLITREAGGTVTVFFAPGQESYAATTRFGVTSEAYGAYGRSFVLVKPDGTAPAAIPTAAEGANWNPRHYLPDRKPGERYIFFCPPGVAMTGLWGTDIYTDDSRVCTAAVHAGLVTQAAGGAVILEIRPGQAQYPASTRNGVTSASWGSYDMSYVFVGAGMPLPTTLTAGPGGTFLVPGSGPLPPGYGGAAREPGGAVAGLAPGGGPCANPRLQAAMDDWLARAVPTAAGDLRYEPWGRAVGRSPSAKISALPRPDTTLSRCDYLLRQAPGLPSRNLGTLLDFLKAAGLI